jgi:hypothetical protein
MWQWIEDAFGALAIFAIGYMLLFMGYGFGL